jgi:hypothetical protein
MIEVALEHLLLDMASGHAQCVELVGQLLLSCL